MMMKRKQKDDYTYCIYDLKEDGVLVASGDCRFVANYLGITVRQVFRSISKGVEVDGRYVIEKVYVGEGEYEQL